MDFHAPPCVHVRDACNNVQQLLGADLANFITELKQCIPSADESIGKAMINLQGPCKASDSIMQLTKSTEKTTHN